MKSRDTQPLLADFLEQIVADGHKPDAPPPVKMWLARHLDEDVLETAILDEAKILPVVDAIIKDGERTFSILPAGLHELRTHYSKLVAQALPQEKYLEKALLIQQKKLTDFLQDLNSGKPVNKELARVEKLLVELKVRIDALGTPEKNDEILKMAALRAGTIIKRSPGRKWELRYIERTEEYLNAFWDIVNEEKRKEKQDLERRTDALSKRKLLLHRLAIEQRIHQVLADTNGALIALHRPVVETVSTKKNTGTASTRKERDGTKHPRPTPEGGTKKTPGGHVRVTPMVASTRERSAPLAVKSAIETSLDMIRDVIDGVKSAHGKKKIRVLSAKSAGKMYTRFQDSWDQLFQAMDFNGTVELVTYADLTATTDTQTPLIIPQVLNTHRSNLWDKSKFKNSCVLKIGNPTLLYNQLTRR